VLVDERATKQAIEDRLDWLARDAAPGDYLLFHFSGHGSAVRDRGPLDELADGLDEILCPHDMDWNGTFITDDELSERLQVPQGVRIEAILDCCHSGSDSEAENDAPAVPRAPDQQPRFLVPPSDIASRHEGSDLAFRSRLLRTREGAARAVIWAGCGAKQTSADAVFSGVPWGAFSQALCGLMRSKRGDVSREKMLELVRSSLSAGGYSQRPELEASAEIARAAMFSGVAP
jgi:hypothetical protein